MKVERVAPGMIAFLQAPAIWESAGSLNTFWSYSCTTMCVLAVREVRHRLLLQGEDVRHHQLLLAEGAVKLQDLAEGSSNIGSLLASKTLAPSEYQIENRLQDRLATAAARR